MALKYYRSQNQNEPIKRGTIYITFEVCQLVAGIFWGAYATDDKEEQKILNEFVDDKKSSIAEIDKDEYDAWQKKKLKHEKTTLSRSNPLGQAHTGPRTLVNAGGAEEGKASDTKTEEPAKPDEPSNEATSEEELSQTHEVDAPIRVISYNELAKNLGVEVDWLKGIAKREDSPERNKKGFLVSEWKTFVEAVKAEASD